ncbi:hypothetical protein AAF712_016890, partial [Marasmius tenuissimus]
ENDKKFSKRVVFTTFNNKIEEVRDLGFILYYIIYPIGFDTVWRVKRLIWALEAAARRTTDEELRVRMPQKHAGHFGAQGRFRRGASAEGLQAGLHRFEKTQWVD